VSDRPLPSIGSASRGAREPSRLWTTAPPWVGRRFREGQAHADWSPDFNVIVDARELVDVGLDYGHMRRVAHEAKRLDAQLGTGRHALVGHTSMLYGCCRMGEQLCQPCGREIVVFRDMAAAELWLGIREEEPSPHSCIRPRDPQVQPAAEKAGDGSKR
jgi:hypothetical protein